MSGPLSLERVRQALGADYEILRLLGQGGMASVYLARERALKRLVALKVLDPDLGASPVFRNRFQREAETAARLEHPHIVPIYRVGEAGGLAFFAMQYVDGDTLADRMRVTGRFDFAEARRIALAVAEALGAAHRLGIIHRDVKPQNILLARDTGRVLVTDFGIAGGAGHAPDDERLTGAGMVMGTPRYMSPEQASGVRELTPASDLYALGVILYELVAGAYPYRLGEPPNYMLAHVTADPIPLLARVGDVPRDLEGAIRRCLAKAPDARFASAGQLADALRAGTVAEAPVRAAGRFGYRTAAGRRRAIVSAALGALCLVVTAGALLVRRPPAAPAGEARRSVLVGYFDNLQRDPALEWLRVGGVDFLGSALGRWQDLRVVDAARLLDLTRRARLDAATRLSQEDVLRLARAAGVGTATLGTVARAGDSLLIAVKVYDVARGLELLSAEASAPDTRDFAALQPAFRALASQILELAGAPVGQLGEVEPPTRSLAAYRAYIEGVQARSRWDLPGATAAFRRAVAEDHAFALAWYELSQAVSAKDLGRQDEEYVHLADSALRYGTARPPRERDLLEAYHAFVHADMPRARAAAGRVLAADSGVADAWSILGTAAALDLTLQRDAAGRERLPASYTEALHAYRRALDLQAGDHRSYAALAQLLASMSDPDGSRVPGFRDPPPGTLFTIGLRVAARWYVPVLAGDSVALVPAESLAQRVPPARLDSARAEARARALEVTRRWLLLAPEEGQAHLMYASLLAQDRQFAAALRSLDSAERYRAFSAVPFPLQRLALRLWARQFDSVTGLGDSLAAEARRTGLGAPLLLAPVASYLAMRGRVAEATQLEQRWRQALLDREASAELRARLGAQAASAGLALRSRAGVVTMADLDVAERAWTRAIDSSPPAQRAALERAALKALLAGSAALGDTARIARWRARARWDSLPGYDAAAALVAGDRARAERLFVRALADTQAVATHLFAVGAVAEGLGRPREALRLYARLDSVPLQPFAVDADLVLASRVDARRGAVQAQLGDTSGAMASWRRYLARWRDADPALRAEREGVARALAELERGGRPR